MSWPVASVLVIVAVVAAVAALLAALEARSRTARLRRLTMAIRHLAEGESIPEVDSEEGGLLAQAVGRIREGEVGRVSTMEEERATREAILAALEEGILLFGPDGELLYANHQARRLLGGPVTSAERLAPARLREAVAAAAGAPSDADPDAPATVEVVAGPTGRTIRASATPVPGGRALLVLRDVTQARLTDAVRRDFVANASHELKTPAATIRALAETIRDSSPGDFAAIKHFAGQLEREAIRLSRIIADLLDLSRLETGTWRESEVRLDQLVRDESERHRSTAEAAHLAFAVKDEGTVRVWGSPEDISLMLRNLIQNAIRYTRPGGMVEVTVGTDDGNGVITVRDTGIGIPARDRRRIFERFYRIDRARSRETGGTGLGLSIVKHVVENHRGTVSVQSELGIGSTFVVRLPRRPAES